MKRVLLLLVVWCGAVPLAFAQCCGYGMSYDNVVVWPQPDLRVRVPTGPGKPAPPILSKAKPAIQANAHTLAQHMPPAKRAEMEKYYIASMDIYLKLEKKMGWKSRDMAGGLAAFVVGNYMVLNDTEVSDDEFFAVAKQLRAQDSLQGMTKTSDPEKLRDVFEQSAMVGAFMALAYKSHQQSPQPPEIYANMRNAASENLKLVLKTDPAKLRIDANGLRIE